MTNKTRKHIWSGALVMTIAIVGVLAVFAVLAADPVGTAAHGPGDPGYPGDAANHGEACEDLSQTQQDRHDAGADQFGGERCNAEPPTQPPTPTPTPTGEPNAPPVVTAAAATVLTDLEMHIKTTHDPIDVADAFSDPDENALTYRATSDNPDVANATIVGSVMTVVTGAVRGTANITVMASDGNGGSVSATPFTVTVIEVYTLTSDPEWTDAHLRATLEDLRPNLDDEEIDELLAGLVAALRELESSAAFDAEVGRPQIYVVLRNGFDPGVMYVAKFNLAVAGSEDDVTVTVTGRPNDGITITDSDGLIGAGFVDEVEGDLEGSLTVKATDAGSRAFEIEGMCESDGAVAIVDVDDKDLNLVAQGAIICLETGDPTVPDPDPVGAPDSVVSYGDWEYDRATDGFIVTDQAGVLHQVNDMAEVRGWLRRDDRAVQSYQLGIDAVEDLTFRFEPMNPDAHPAEQPAGQTTTEVRVGEPNVQLTVSSRVEGPKFLRFRRPLRDSDANIIMLPGSSQPQMETFGTDVDEQPMYRGGDIVGLDSQGKLVMNPARALTAAQALAYDQYEIFTPHDNLLIIDNPDLRQIDDTSLRGVAGSYHQGTFRVFNPCPSELFNRGGHYFNVEVYEKTGKYLQTVETVKCVEAPGVVPSALAVTTYSDHPGRARLSWEPATGAIAHWVIAFETDTRRVVAGSIDRIEAPDYDVDITGLMPNTRYTFAVLAERREASGETSYSLPSSIIQTMIWGSR